MANEKQKKEQQVEPISPTKNIRENIKASTNISETAVLYFDKSGKKSRKLSLRYSEDIEIEFPTKNQANIVFSAMEEYLKYHQIY